MKKNLNLTRQFGFLSLVVILLIALISGYAMARFLTAKLLSREATLTAEFIDSVVITDRLWRPFEAHERGEPTPEFEYFFHHISRVPGVVHANIYGTDRRLLWATERAGIGQQFAENDELDAALEGRLAYETGVTGQDDGKEEHARLDDVDTGMHFVEIYVPVRNVAGDRVVGVVELYKEPKALHQSIIEAVELVWIIALISAAVLYAALYWIVKRAGQVIDDQNRQLVETESLSMIGETASAVAHAMRNPLASIRASAELTLSDDIDGARESARDIIGETDRLERWARDLLRFSRAGSEYGHGSADVVTLLNEQVAEHRATLDRANVSVDSELAAGPLRVDVDPVPLAQVLGSLFVNAIEAMPSGGRITLSAGPYPTDARRVQVTISDTGGGLPAAMEGRLFKPFATTKPNGTGLGLALAKRLVQYYDGQLVLNNLSSEGLSATLVLPRART